MPDPLTIDVITGGKGGIGKTLWALLLAHNYRMHSHNIAFADFNSVNSDLKWLFHRDLVPGQFTPRGILSLEEDSADGAPRNTFNPNTANVVFRQTKRLPHVYIGSLADPFDMLTPTSFSRFLRRIHLMHEKYMLNARRLIIDTNYHPTHLFGRETLVPLTQHSDAIPLTLRLWFLWTPRIVRLLLHHAIDPEFIFSDEVARFFSTLDSFDHYSRGSAKAGKLQTEVIHVLPAVSFATPPAYRRQGMGAKRFVKRVLPVSWREGAENIGTVAELETLNLAWINANSDGRHADVASSSMLTTLFENIQAALRLSVQDVISGKIDYRRVVDLIAKHFTNRAGFLNLLALPIIDQAATNYHLDAFQHDDPIDYVGRFQDLVKASLLILETICHPASP